MTLQSQFAATLVDEWSRSGVRHAVVAPGSRSSPIAIALLSEPRIEVHVRLDERSACFYALGLALASGTAVLMVTSSGTAAVEVHAAVVEADLSGVPLIICTADRPPELHRVGAAQTIEQTGLYGGSVRYSADIGVPDLGNRPQWRSLASRLVAEATAGPMGPGPVHVNLPFREPLTGEVGELPDPAPGGGAWHAPVRARASDERVLEQFLSVTEPSSRAVVVLGGGAVESDSKPLVELAERLGWPILVDARGMAREPFEPVVVHSDAILRSRSASGPLMPDLVVNVGGPHAGRTMESFLARAVAAGVPQLFVDRVGRFADPARRPGPVLVADPASLFSDVLGAHPGPVHDRGFLENWRAADDAADRAIAEVLEGEGGLTEPFVARRLVELAPPTSTIFSSASMPIRDLEWFAPRRHAAPRLLTNRGANGIDGVTSTLLGVAAAEAGVGGGPVLGLTGDLALLHDLSGLVWGSLEQVPPATIVVVDNAGGGIFNFLSYPDELEGDVFERGFGTPQSVDLAALMRAFGARGAEPSTPAAFDDALRESIAARVLSVVIVRTERRANVALHARLNDAVVAAVDAALHA